MRNCYLYYILYAYKLLDSIQILVDKFLHWDFGQSLVQPTFVDQLNFKWSFNIFSIDWFRFRLVLNNWILYISEFCQFTWEPRLFYFFYDIMIFWRKYDFKSQYWRFMNIVLLQAFSSFCHMYFLNKFHQNVILNFHIIKVTERLTASILDTHHDR